MTTPHVFLPYQAAFVRDPAPVRVIEKSRRIGLSWAVAADCVLTAATVKKDGGMDQWYVGYNHDMAREFIEDAADFTRAFQLTAEDIEETLIEDEKTSILAFQIRFASGHKVTALSSRPSNLRGKQGHAIIDEAAFHDDLKELLKAAIAFLMWGGRVSVISTHNGVENAFNEILTDSRSGRLNYSVHRVTLDDALEQGLYQRICLQLGKEWSQEAEDEWRQELVAFYGDGADEELFCIPSKSGGIYLPRSLVESRMYDAPIARLELAGDFTRKSESARKSDIAQWCEQELAPLLDKLENRPHHVGQDFGRVSDLSVIAPLTLCQDLTRRCPFLVELRNVPYESQRQVLFYVLDKLPKLHGVALDATGNGAYLGEATVMYYGETRAEAVSMSVSWYAENLPPFKAAFEDALIEVPRDADILNDLAALQVIDGVPRLPKLKNKDKHGKPRHGDAAIALALAHYASRRFGESFGYVPVKPENYADKRRVRSTHGLRGRKGLW